MDVSNFTDKSKTVIATASNLAVQNRNAEIDVSHLILAMLDRKENLIYQLLVKMDVNDKISPISKNSLIRSVKKIINS